MTEICWKCIFELILASYTRDLVGVLIPQGLAGSPNFIGLPNNLVTTVAHNCHGKTKKTSWSAVGQQLLFQSEMVTVTVTVTVTHCSLERQPFFELTMFCTACGSVANEDRNRVFAFLLVPNNDRREKTLLQIS